MRRSGFHGKNIALSVHAEVAPYAVEAVSTSESLPEEVDVCSLLQDRTTRSKQFFTKKSREAPCISMTHVKPTFWKSMENQIARPNEELDD